MLLIFPPSFESHFSIIKYFFQCVFLCKYVIIIFSFQGSNIPFKFAEYQSVDMRGKYFIRFGIRFIRTNIYRILKFNKLEHFYISIE